jgi:FkbM family methyltransferase
MEKIIHFTVRDPRNLSSVQADVIDRARKLHPNWEIKVWGDPIPGQGCGFLLEKYWPKANSGAQLADLIRLDVLYRFGGVYVDSDLKLVKPLDDLVNRFEFFIASENGEHLTNALFGARKDSLVLRYLIDQLNSAEPDWTLPPHMTTGPQFFGKHLRWRKDITVLPRESFYTYGPFFEGRKTIHRHSYGEHLWDYSWKPTDEDLGVYSVPPPALSKKSNAERAWQLLVDYIKKPIRICAVSGFNIWHRLQNLDPMRRRPVPRQQSYECSGELVVRTIHDYKIIADGHDVSITPELVFNGFYELPEQLLLIDVVRGGDWVIDIGANIGTLSLLAAKQVGPFGRVFAFEPNARPSTLMAKSLVMNWMHDRVIHRQVAVGETSCTVKLTFISDRLGDGQVGQDEVIGSTFAESLRTLGRERAVVLEVPCVRLDDEFPVDLPIKFLKIDAEGYEAFVLAGADRLLRRRCVDYILIELSEEVSGSRWHETVKQVNKVITYGYGVFGLTEEGGIVDQSDLAAAIRRGYRNIVLVAREQYSPS